MDEIWLYIAHDNPDEAGRIVEEPPATPLPLTVPLDPGEHEAIALALATQAEVLLIDE